MASRLTPKQKQTLDWIEEFSRTRGTFPSRREIASGLGLSSPATIQQHIEALEKKGFLKRGEAHESRGLEWTARSRRLFQEQPDLETVPLIGTIAAGFPIEVFPEPEQKQIPLQAFLRNERGGVSREGIFMLAVRGDSMIEDGILPGDWVILRKSSSARPGETVAALLNGEATLKRFQKTPRGPELHPANLRYPVLSIREGDRFQIQGILIGLLRQYS